MIVRNKEDFKDKIKEAVSSLSSIVYSSAYSVYHDKETKYLIEDCQEIIDLYNELNKILNKLENK